ncbi:MAG: hypothetical protein ACE366_29015 [Bradymonadia bacterium]
MNDPTLTVLLWAAASVAFMHTLIGVDHYLPFILIGKARNWSLRKTLGFTALCGVGHVVGSVALGLIGVGLGVAVERLEIIEGFRGSIAAWGLIAFGLIYAAISAWRAAKGKHHSHVHAHEDGTLHHHDHNHQGNHAHAHGAGDRKGMTRWALFILFVLGPCEALIPMFMAPAYAHDWSGVISVAAVFSVVTILTMVAAVAVGAVGLSFAPLKSMERHANTLAGLAIASSGLAIQMLGI